VLETGVGTSRNLELYPYDCKVTGIDYSPLALEIALTKNTSNEIDYKLEDVER
jgi:Methyltransferase domain